MANVRFDQFVDGGEMRIGDIPVGLRVTDLSNNYKFNFPGSGIKDSDGNYLFQYTTVGALAVNFPILINSISGNAVTLTAGGTDPNIGITIRPLADGVLTLDTLTWPTSDGVPNSFLFTDGAGHLHFTSGSVTTSVTGTIHQVLVNGTTGVPVTGAVTLSTPQDIDTTSSPTFNAPIFTAPLLGTPASGILTNCTGLPLTTGVIGILQPTHGGTGVNNGASTLTLGGSLTTSGAFASTFTMTGTTNVTFPTSGTLATTSQLPTPSPLTEVNDTNVTMTLGGTPATALLQAVSMTLGWTGQLSPIRGGTGVNNGASTLTLGGSLTTSGAFTSTFTMTGATSVTFPTTGTLATTSQLPTPSALTEVNDTNVTMTLGGSPSTALLQPVSMTLGWAGELSLARGGTNASLSAVNGGIVYSTASALAILSPTSSATLITNLTGIPVFSSHMLDGQVIIGATAGTPTAANLTGGTNITISNSANGITINAVGAGVVPSAMTSINDTNVTLTLGGTPATSLLQAVSLTLGWTGQLSLSRGGTNASLTASNGGIVYSTGTALAILGGTATANQVLLSGLSSSPSWSTATYPATTTINQLLYSSSNNTISGLSTANSAGLVTNSSGVPAFTASMTNGQVIIGSTGGTPAPATLTAGSNITITNAANSITISAAGSGITPSAMTSANDTNVTITLGGTPATSLLQPVSLTMGWTGQLSMARGGTNANLTAALGIVYSTASSMAILGSVSGATLVTTLTGIPTFTSHMLNGQIVIGNTVGGPIAANLTAGSNISITNGANSITIDTVNPIPTGAALTATNDTNVTLTLGGSPSTALVNAASITAGWTGQLSLSRGGTNASLTASNGGIVYSTASALAILASTASASLVTNASGIPVFTSAMTNGQIVIGSTGATPVSATLTAGAGITITNGAGSITIASTGATSGRLLNIQVFKASGTYTPTSGMSHCLIQCIGGGGAAGGSIVGVNTGGGGGAGSYSQSYVSSGTIGASQTVTIGAGGTGVSGANGNNGNATSVGTIVIANGGSGGAVGSAVVNDVSGGAGGTAGTGDIALPGNAGGNGISAGSPGQGGSNIFGGTTLSPTSAGNGISAAANTGAGGSGASGSGTNTGGNGGSGLVIIYEYS